MATTEHLGLQLDADASGWDGAFRQAEKSSASLGGSVDKVVASANKFGTALSGAAAKGVNDFGKLMKTASDAEKRIEALGKKQAGLWDGITKKMVTAELVIGGLGKAWAAVGDYMAGAFDRAKIDPALAGINQMREATEEWTRTWQSAVDGVLNKIAQGIAGDPTRTTAGARAASARTSALNALRERGVPTFEDAMPGTLEWARQNALEESAEYKKLYNQYGSQFDQRFVIPGQQNANRIQIAMGLTTAAIARDRGVAGQSQVTPRILGQLGDWASGVGWQAQNYLGADLRNFWGPSPEKRRAGGGSPFDMAGYLNRPGQQGASSFLFPDEEGGGGGPLFPGLQRLGSTFGDAATRLGNDFRYARELGQSGEIEKMPRKISELEASMRGVGDSVAATIGAAISAGEAGTRAIFRMGAAQMKTTAITEGVLALANAWNPTGATHAAAAAAALAGMAVLGALGGGIGGGGVPTPASGARSTPGGGFAMNRSQAQSEAPTNITVNINGFVGTNKHEAIAAISQGIREGEAAGRVRYSSSRVTRYGEG